MTQIIALALVSASVALGILCAWTIQTVTYGGYVFELGLVLAGGAFVAGVCMMFERH